MKAEIQKIYVAFFNRPADVAGLDFWASSIASGTATLEDLTSLFASSQEYADLYAGRSSKEVVSAVYRNLFGREPEAEGASYWAEALSSNRATPGLLAYQVLNGALGTDKSVIDNKAIAASHFTQALAEKGDEAHYSGDTILKAREWLGGVGASEASLDLAIDVIPETLNMPDATPGKSYSFTLGWNGTPVQNFVNSGSATGFDASKDTIDITARAGYDFSPADKIYYQHWDGQISSMGAALSAVLANRGDGQKLMAGEHAMFSWMEGSVKRTVLFVDDGRSGSGFLDNGTGSAISSPDSDLTIDLTGIHGLTFGPGGTWVDGSFLQ